MGLFADALAGARLSSIHASTEQKAMDGAAIVAERLRMPYGTHEDLGENVARAYRLGG